MHKLLKTQFKHRFFILLMALLLVFLCNAFFHDESLQFMLNLMFIVLIVASLLTITQERARLVLPCVLFGLSIALVMISGGISSFSHDVRIIQLGLVISFLLLITGTTLQSTLRFEKVTSNTLYGAVCSYLLIGLTFTYLFLLIYELDPNSFRFLFPNEISQLPQNFTYYSFVTLTTLGYGDILPVSIPAKTFAWFEAVIGQVYLTILIAQLVGLFIVHKQKKLSK